MNSARQQNKKARSFGGFYFRAGGRAWFWGWGAPPSPAAEPSWGSLGEWLRRLRAQTALAGRDNGVARQAIQAAEAAPLVPSANQTPARERKLHFVCDRHFIGFVLR